MEQAIRVARINLWDMRRMVESMRLYNPDHNIAYYVRVNHEVEQILNYLDGRRIADGTRS